MEYFDPFYFLIALFIGILYTGLTTPLPEVIIRYPTPENAGKIIYRDKADVCYKYSAEEVGCPADKSKIKRLDIQGRDGKKGTLFSFIQDKVKELTTPIET